MLLASQLNEFSRRFPEHVRDLREFLAKETLPVPSPEAIPQLSARLRTDAAFRADVSSLVRVALYREREGIGYEDLLGMLAVAAAGTEHDLNSEEQDASLREILRFVLQSRRSMLRPEEERTEEEEEKPVVATKPDTRVRVKIEPEPFVAEPVLVGALRSNAGSGKRETKATQPPSVVPAREDREPVSRESEDLVLPAFRTSGLFASHIEKEPATSRSRAVWVVGCVCMLVGLCLGLMFHRVVSAAEMHAVVASVLHRSSQQRTPSSVAQTPDPEGSGAVSSANSQPVSSAATETPAAGPRGSSKPVAADGATQATAGNSERADSVQHSMEGVSSPPPAGVSKVPVTVVRQVVTASPSGDEDEDTGATQITAATHAIMPKPTEGVTAANVIFSPAPEYPPAASAARVQGQVTVRAVVDPEGNVIYARAVSGPSALRDAAQEAVHKWRYRPLLYNGKPIAVTTTAILDFRFAR